MISASASFPRGHLKLEVWNPGCESVWPLDRQSVVDHLAQPIVSIAQKAFGDLCICVVVYLCVCVFVYLCVMEYWITALGGIMWDPSILLINGSWEFILIFWQFTPPNLIFIFCQFFVSKFNFNLLTILVFKCYLYTGQYHWHGWGTFFKLVGIENLRSSMQEMISTSFWTRIGAFPVCYIKQMVLVLDIDTARK